MVQNGYKDGRKHITKVYHYATIDSTNEQAKKLAREGAPHGTLVVADAQTKGKGRLGRSFYSPENRGIYMSVILRGESSKPESCDIFARLTRALGDLSVTAAAAVSACKGIETTCGACCDIKWVNDIYLCGRKVCGILAEAGQSPGSRAIDFVVVGIGVNCVGSALEFPSELQGRAGSISEAKETAFEGGEASRADKGGFFADVGTAEGRKRLALAIAEELLACAAGEYPAEMLLEEYKRRCFIIGKDIYIYRNACGGRGVGLDENGAAIPGIPARAIGIDKSGGLLVRYPDGKEAVLTDGEVSVRLKKA